MNSSKNFVIAGLLVTTLAGAALAWHQHLELVKLRAAALKPDERADWQRRIADAERHRAELEQQLAATKGPSAGSGSPSAEPASSIEPFPPLLSTTARGDRPNQVSAVMERPEVQRLMALQHKAALDGRYAQLFKQLGLPASQLEQFKQLLVEKTTAAMDVMAAARDQGLNPRSDREAFRKLVTDAEAEIDGSIRALLGETGYTQYKSYEQTIPQRAVVTQLEQRLSYSDTPLAPEQSAQLVRILAQNQNGNAPSTFEATVRTAAGANRGQASPISDVSINQSLGVLAAPQVEALRQLQQEQQAQAELLAALRSQRGSRGPAAAPAQAGAQPTPVPPPSPRG